MATLNDLIVKCRRGTLTRAQLRQLETTARGSREVRVALLASAGFDAEGLPQSGDSEFIAALVQNVTSGPKHSTPAPGAATRPSQSGVQPRPGNAGWLKAVAPLLIAVAGAAAYSEYPARSNASLRSAPSSTVALPPARALVPPTADAAVAKPSSPASPSPSKIVLPSRLVAPKDPAPLRRRTRRIRPRVKLAPRDTSQPASPAPSAPPASTPEPASDKLDKRAASKRALPTAESHGTPSTVALVEKAATPTEVFPSASALLKRARLSRTRSWPDALTTYRTLVAHYPNSRQAGIAEMALAKRATALGRHVDALQWYERHQNRHSSPLRAEAFWGAAMAFQQLDKPRSMRETLERMSLLFPSTPYGQAARQLLSQPARLDY